jgi:K+-sensing histidine kinase KdpD
MMVSTQDSVDWALPTPERGVLVLFASASLLLVAAIGVLDVVSGIELTLSPLYLLAVIIGAWRGGPWIGIMTAIASALTGLLADMLLSEPYLHLENDYSSAWIPVCNAIARGVVLVAATATVTKLQTLLRDRDGAAREHKRALEQIRTLESLLPVCAWCKRIRDVRADNEWKTIEHYIAEHTDSKFTHGMCPECCERVWREEGL